MTCVAGATEVSVGPHELRAACPRLSEAVDALVKVWLAPVIARQKDIAEQLDEAPRLKHVNDPVWRTFDLEPQEVLLIDSPLLQRLRGVKQLGLANLVFPGANHDRFEHVCGTVQAADRVYQALKTNADRRRPSEQALNQSLPHLEAEDRLLVRLAALLHDVGHGPFSHAIEPVVAQQFADELRAFNKLVARELDLDAKVAVAELISVLVVLSPSFREVLARAPFSGVFKCPPAETQMKLATLIMGARRHGQLPCLSAIISGQVDADKLDYMTRDALHSGMPIEFDTERLLRKLEIVRCDPENLPANQAENRRFAEDSPGGQYFDLGISASGVGALEQMLIGRAFLYDRLYHHHKVRAADAMAQRMLHFAQIERSSPFDLAELYRPVSDDTLIRILAGAIEQGSEASGRAAKLGRAILSRDLYVRAFAFRASFHPAAIAEPDEQLRAAALAEAWSPVSTGLADLQDRLSAEEKIVAIARRLGPATGDERLAALAAEIDESDVVVDLAENRVKPVTINVHAEDGSLEAPNLFFDPARWSHVYDLQKRTGYVFCSRKFVALVGLAAKVFFFEEWGYAVTEKADRLTKTLKDIRSGWLDNLTLSGEIDGTTSDVLRRSKTPRLFIREGDIKWPEEWANENADLDADIVDSLRNLLPQGLSAGDRDAVRLAIEGVASFIALVHKDSTLPTGKILEKDLQERLRQHLRSRLVDVSEGQELGGGETDLIIRRRVIIENKIVGKTSDPASAKPTTPYQANRYSVSICTRVVVSVIAYQPIESADPIEQTSSIIVRSIPNLNRTAVEVVALVPYGMSTPSTVRAPAPTKEDR